MPPLPRELKLELQRDYIATFDQKLLDLQIALRANDGAGDFDRLLELFHKLAGSGTTYEMPEITRVAREAELATTAFADQGKLDHKTMRDFLELLAKIFASEKNRV